MLHSEWPFPVHTVEPQDRYTQVSREGPSVYMGPDCPVFPPAPPSLPSLLVLPQRKKMRWRVEASPSPALGESTRDTRRHAECICHPRGWHLLS